MSLWVPTSDDERTEFLISFDEDGHLYFERSTGEIFEIDFDRENRIVAHRVELERKLAKSPLYRSSLRVTQQALSKLTEEMIDLTNRDSDDEDEPTDFYPEDREADLVERTLDDDDEEDDEEDESDEEPHFAFSRVGVDTDFSDSPTIPVYASERGTALYETLIYRKNDLCFRTYLYGETPCFRLKVNLDGEISFRPIGDRELKFHPVYNHPDLLFNNAS